MARLLFVLLSCAAGAHAATYNVTTNADSGPGSLRDAVAQANAHAGADTITFDTGLGAINLVSGQIDITETLTIAGPAAGQLIDASETSRIFAATTAGQALTLRNLELRRGVTDGLTVAGDCTHFTGQGAAVCALGPVLLTDTTITASYALNADGGGIHVDGADLIAIRTAITQNSIFNANPVAGGGGIHVEGGSVALLESRVADNRTYGEFAAGGGIHVAGGSLVMSNSSLTGNGTLGNFSPGGGAYVSGGDIDIQSCTVSGNTTAAFATLSFGGGLHVRDGNVTINAGTVSANFAAAGAGVYLDVGAARRLDLTSTILSGNATDNLYPGNATINASFSLFGDAAGEINGTNLNNVFSNAPDLGPLADNGCASTAGRPGTATAQCPRTQVPKTTSPALDAGSNAQGYPTDQRGTGYARTVGPQPDIGAIENGPGLLEFSLQGYIFSESGPAAAITVARRQGSYGAVSVGYATSDGTATAGSDYTAAAGTLNWGAGDDTAKSFNVSITDDAVWEPSETVNLTLSAPGGGAVLGTRRQAVLTINDNDSGPGYLRFSSATYAIAENLGLVTITVERVEGSNGTISVDYATSNGTALAGSDYTTKTGTLFWANGDLAPKTFNVSIANDATAEPDETFNVTLSNPQFGAVLGSPAAAVVTIVDNDGPGRFEFSAPTYTFGENDGLAQVIVNRVGGLGGAVSVQFATSDGTATAGADYGTFVQTHNWASGDGSPWYIYIPVYPDAQVEPTESVRLALSNPTGGATLGAQSGATLFITDANPTTSGQLRFATSNYVVAENAVTATITVSRIGGTTGAVSIDFASTAGGTATAGADYQAVAGTLAWNDGDAADKTFNVTILDDALVEGNETVVLQLSNPAGGAMLGTPSSATLTIRDNESVTPGQLQFSANTYAVGESAGSVTITVERVGGTDGAASVHYTSGNGSATAGSDYTAVSGNLNWADGDGAPKTFNVTILPDTLVEGNESFFLGLSAATGATLGTPAAAAVTITDDDSALPGALRLSKSLYVGREGGPQVVVTVSRVGGAAGAISVDYATGAGTATAGSDYTAAAGTLNWANGDAADKTFTVTVLDDTLLEGLEWTFVSLSNPAGGAVLRNPRVAALAILDNEAAQPQLQAPTVAKAFGAPTAPLAGRTTLAFTIANPNAGNAIAGIGFTDDLPTGMLVANPSGLAGSCGGGTITANPGANTVSLAGATLAAGANCTFSLEVTTTSIGVRPNTTSVLSWGTGLPGATSNTATLTTIATLDVDGSNATSRYDALTDGLLLLRYMFGLTGTALTNGALGATATRTTPADIMGYLDAMGLALDIDGNGTVDALTDGLLTIRYLFGLRGTGLTAGAIGAGATRPGSAAVESYLQSLMP